MCPLTRARVKGRRDLIEGVATLGGAKRGSSSINKQEDFAAAKLPVLKLFILLNVLVAWAKTGTVLV
uniref:Uncharacterized protein n=1 Tax=Amphimedon queenslandica TaxID=400682 RepID=A0A1X7V6A2_AMPQE